MKKIIQMALILIMILSCSMAYAAKMDHYALGDIVSIGRYLDPNGDYSLAQAKTDIGADNKQLVINEPITLYDDCNMPDNIAIKVTPNGLISLVHVDLVLHGDIDAGLYQVFDVDANSSVAGLDVVQRSWFGSGTSSFTQAIAACATGGTIKFTPGETWTGAGQYTINKACIIDGQNSEISWASDTSASRGLLVTASNVTIKDLELDGPQHATQVATQRGIYAYGADKDNYITNLKTIGCKIHDWGVHGIKLEFVDKFWVQNNEVYENEYSNIMCFSSKNGDISKNRVHTTAPAVDGYGIELTRTENDSIVDYPHCENINIHHNIVSDISTWKGIGSHGGINISINNNQIFSCYIGIGVAGSDDSSNHNAFAPTGIKIDNNIIDSQDPNGTAGYGIFLAGAYYDGNVVDWANGVVSNNTVIRHGRADSVNGCALYFHSFDGVSISNNVIKEPGTNGIYLTTNDKNFSITGNQIIDVWSDSNFAYPPCGIRTAHQNNTGYIENNSFIDGEKTATYLNNTAIYIYNNIGNEIRIGKNHSKFDTYLTDAGGYARFLDPQDSLNYGNAYTDTVLQNAITGIGSTHYSLNISRGTWVIDADLTFNANTRLKFEEGAVFDINQSGTDPTDVVINGDLDAGLYQVFDVDANSTLTMPNVTDIYTAWFNDDLDDAVGAISSINQLLHINDTTLNSNIAIAKDIRVILDCDATSTLSANPIFDFDGTLSGITYTLSADENEGSETVVVTSATGLAAGDYIYFYQPFTRGGVAKRIVSHYRIDAVASTTLTLDRALDLDANSTNCVIYEHTPYRFDFNGNGKTVSMSGVRPKFISSLYSRDSKISDLHLYFSGNEPVASTTVVKPIYIDKCYGATLENITFKNLDGGSEFSCIGIYNSSVVDIDNVSVIGTKGRAGAIVVLYSTQCDIHNCKLYGIGAGTGAIYPYFCSYINIDNNLIHSTRYYSSDGSPSGVQITGSVDINCRNNSINNCSGVGEIYVSGASDGIIITGNNISHSGITTSTAYHSAIHLRSGTDIICNNNLIKTDGATGIHLRGIDGYELSNNTLVSTGTHGIALTYNSAADADEAAYYPSNGVVIGNNITLTNDKDTCKAFSLGSKAYANKISNNKIQFNSSSDGAGNKWGMILSAADTKTDVHDNYVFACNTDANYVVLGVQLSSFTGSFYDNMADGNNCTEYTFTTCTGYGWDNISIDSGLVYGYIAGDAYYKGNESLSAKKYGTTATRPTLTTYDAGFVYWDTDAAEAIVWNGTGWVACDGTGI